jgi:hypothetical protein
MKKTLYFIFKTIILFSILFDINFVFAPGITTARVALATLILVAFVKKPTFQTHTINFLTFLIVLLSFSILQYLFSKDFSQSSRLIWFCLYGVIAPFLYLSHVKNRTDFFLSVSIVAFIQAILTICSYLNPAIKSSFSSLIIFTSNYDDQIVLRALNFASVGGASFSVIQSSGVISLLILNHICKLNFIKTTMSWVAIVIILISIVFTGRTGLFISIFAIVTYLLLNPSVKKFSSLGLFLLIFSQINFLGIIDKFTSNIEGYKSEIFVQWIESSFDLKGNSTVEALNEMPIPKISLKTIIGTGKVVDENGQGNACRNDSGYIQTYYSLGLILAMTFYIGYLLFLNRIIKLQRNKALYLLPLIVFFIEYKEPFIFSYSFPFFVLCTILIFNKTNNETGLLTVILKK